MAHAGDVLRNPANGYEYRILRSAADTGGELLDMDVTVPAGATEPPLHLHPRQEERFEVLSGAVAFRLGGEHHRLLGPGEVLVIPAGTPHAMWNPAGTSARVGWQTRPALRTEQLFETLVALAAAGRVNSLGVPHPLDAALVTRAFDDEIRLTRPPRAVQRIVFGALGALARLLGRRLPPPTTA